MPLFEIGMLIILVTLCVMCVVNRICKCIEHKATVKAFASTQENNLNVMNPAQLIEAVRAVSIAAKEDQRNEH